MIRQKSGRIINMSSQAGFVALPTESVYCMTKAAIAHLTKVGEIQHHGECGRTDIYPYSGDGGRPCQPRVLLGRDRAYCCVTPHW
jgi:hypothetical protein